MCKGWKFFLGTDWEDQGKNEKQQKPICFLDDLLNLCTSKILPFLLLSSWVVRTESSTATARNGRKKCKIQKIRMFFKFCKYVERLYSYKFILLVITGQIVFWYERSKLHFSFWNKTSLSQRKHHLCFTAVTAKLGEMQRTFHNMHKPYSPLQMAQHLAQEPLCSAH